MSNLRSLLHSGDAKYVGQTPADFALNPHVASSLKPTGCTQVFQMRCHYTPDSNYGQACVCSWCTPSSADQITFEIWGGGGGGAGACCCQNGQPGGSGAYAKKTVFKSELTAGQCYCFCIAYPTDCAVTCCGILGCVTRVSGQGLSNFCAEGGVGGKNCCFTFWGNYSCVGNCCATGRLYLCYDQNTCRCFYGADSGSPGKAGWLWAQCACGPCYWKYAIPYPGGLINQCGGYMMSRVQGNACNNEWMKCGVTFGYHSNTTDQFVPGMGGLSATSCGGGCCYGFGGNPGMVKITYK